MTRRWVCPKCADGCHAPSRPRRDDARRFCLPCTAKTGRLVERTCPARETAAKVVQDRRQAAAVKRAEARALKQAADRELRQASGEARAALRALPVGDLYRATTTTALEVATKRYCKLAAWERDLSSVEVSFRRSSTKRYTSGRAWPSSMMRMPAAQCPRPDRPGRIVITVGIDAADSPHAVILHELAHIAAGPDAHHDTRWRSFFLLAASEVAGERIMVSGDLDKYQFHSVVRDKLAAHIFKGDRS